MPPGSDGEIPVGTLAGAAVHVDKAAIPMTAATVLTARMPIRRASVRRGCTGVRAAQARQRERLRGQLIRRPAPLVLAADVGDGEVVGGEEFIPGSFLRRQVLGAPLPFGNRLIGIEPGDGELASVLAGESLDSAESRKGRHQLKHPFEGSLV